MLASHYLFVLNCIVFYPEFQILIQLLCVPHNIFFLTHLCLIHIKCTDHWFSGKHSLAPLQVGFCCECVLPPAHLGFVLFCFFFLLTSYTTCRGHYTLTQDLLVLSFFTLFHCNNLSFYKVFALNMFIFLSYLCLPYYPLY